VQLSDYNIPTPATYDDAMSVIDWLLDRIDQLNEIIDDLDGDKYYE